MSVCFADKVEAAVHPYSGLEELVEVLKSGRGPSLPALLAAIRALELLRDFLADEEGG